MKDTEKRGLMAFSDVLGGKWKLLILYELVDGPRRFLEIRNAMPGLSSKVLTDSVLELVKNGLVVRISYPEVPPRVDYALSKKGRSLIPLLQEMIAWGIDYQKYRGKWNRCSNPKKNAPQSDFER